MGWDRQDMTGRDRRTGQDVKGRDWSGRDGTDKWDGMRRTGMGAAAGGTGWTRPPVQNSDGDVPPEITIFLKNSLRLFKFFNMFKIM